MHVVLTNLGAVAVPFSSAQDKGFVQMLEPGQPVTLDSPAVTIANVGDNPSAMEEFTAGMKNLIDKIGELILFWREKNEKAGAEAPHQVQVSIENKGPNALRVLLGSNMNEMNISAGVTYTATATEYVEIRELGV